MEMNFNISRANAERLFAIKKLLGKDNLTGNDFAAELLEKELERLFPPVPQYDDNDNLINADRFKG